MNRLIEKVGILLMAFTVSFSSHALVVTSFLEVLTIANVGSTFQTVNLTNTYTSAIPICTYNLPSIAAVPAVVRINNITTTSFDVKIQNPTNASTSGPVTPDDVYCIVTEEGVQTLPDGRQYEAHTVTSTGTNGQFLGWGNGFMENVTASIINTYTSPVVLGQVISNNDFEYSTFWTNNGSQTTPPTNSSIYVGKQTGTDALGRANEVLGYIVAEAGSGNVNGIDYELALGADSILGATAPGSYSFLSTYSYGVAILNAMDGGNGGWAVFSGAAPFAGNAINLAIDEDLDRGHTTEQVAYWVMEPVSISDLSVTIDDSSATYAPGAAVTYTIVVTNNGINDALNVNVVNDELPGTTTFTSWNCTATGGATCPNASSVGSINETAPTIPNGGVFTYVVNVDISSGTTGNLVNAASVTTPNYDPNTTDNNASDTDTQSSLIDIDVSNDDGNTVYTAGSTIQYTLSVTNNGPSDASTVLITNVAPAGTTIASWTCTGTSCPNGVGSVVINETAATIPSGQSLVYLVNIDVPVSFTGNLVNSASANGAETDSNVANNTSVDTDGFDIDTDMDGIPDTIEIGIDPLNPVDTDNDTIPDFMESNLADTDADGLTNEADDDDDGDGLLTAQEVGSGGAANPADSNGDGIPDYLSYSIIQTGIDGGLGATAPMLLMLLGLIPIIIRRKYKCKNDCYGQFY